MLSKSNKADDDKKLSEKPKKDPVVNKSQDDQVRVNDTKSLMMGAFFASSRKVKQRNSFAYLKIGFTHYVKGNPELRNSKQTEKEWLKIFDDWATSGTRR